MPPRKINLLEAAGQIEEVFIPRIVGDENDSQV